MAIEDESKLVVLNCACRDFSECLQAMHNAYSCSSSDTLITSNTFLTFAGIHSSR